MEMCPGSAFSRLRFLTAALSLLALSTAAVAAPPDPPRVSIERTMADLVRVQIDGGVSASGYNLYRDGRYVTTVRPPNGANAFPARIGTAGGEICVVAFEETPAGTDYSACSVSTRIEPADPERPGGEPAGPPSAPVNLRAVVYSRGTAELFWDAARDEGRVLGYRVSRDGEEIFATDGRSLFQPDLDPERAYRYEVVAIDDEGARSCSRCWDASRTSPRCPRPRDRAPHVAPGREALPATDAAVRVHPRRRRFAFTGPTERRSRTGPRRSSATRCERGARGRTFAARRTPRPERHHLPDGHSSEREIRVDPNVPEAPSEPPPVAPSPAPRPRAHDRSASPVRQDPNVFNALHEALRRRWSVDAAHRVPEVPPKGIRTARRITRTERK